MNILLGNSGNRLEIVNDIKLLCDYDIQIKRYNRNDGHVYVINIYLLHPYNVCICEFNASIIWEDSAANYFNCTSIGNKRIILGNDMNNPRNIFIPGGFNEYTKVPVNEDAVELMDKKIDELAFMVKRDIAIMTRFGNTFNYPYGDSFDSLFGHIP